MTIKAAADALEWSETKVWRIESGQTSMRVLDVEAMCRVYGAPADLAEALMALAKETRAKGWWVSYGDVIPEGFDVYIGLEEAAVRLLRYEAEFVPGLFQTEDYARTVIRAHRPDFDDAEVDRRVQLRMARQSLITRPTAPDLRVILSESVLRRPVGGKRAMGAQLNRLAAATDLPTVSLRVTPFDLGMHVGVMSGSFTLLEFPMNGNGQPNEPPTVYVEGFTGRLFLDKPMEIDRYRAAFNGIWAGALDQAASRDLIRKAIEEFEQ